MTRRGNGKGMETHGEDECKERGVTKMRKSGQIMTWLNTNSKQLNPPRRGL